MTNAPAQSLPTAPTAGPQVARLGLWQRLSFGLAHAVVTGLLVALGLRGLYAFGQAFGTIEWSINNKRRRRFATMLARIHGEMPPTAERRRQTRAYFMQSRCDKLFYLIFDRIPLEKARGLFSIEPKEWIDENVESGRGVHLAVSHLGPLHVLSLVLSTMGYKVVGVRDPAEAGLRVYIQQRLQRHRPDFSPTRWLFTNSFPREIFRCYQDGCVLGSAMDIARIRDPKQSTETVTFLGEEHHFLTGPMKVAYRCKVPVFQTFIIPEPGFHYRVELPARLIEPEHPKDEAATIREAMQNYTANAETYMKRYPHLVSRI